MRVREEAGYFFPKTQELKSDDDITQPPEGAHFSLSTGRCTSPVLRLTAMRPPQEMLHFSIFLDQIKCGSACSSSTDRVFNFIIVGSQLSTLGLLKHPGVGATGVRLMATQRVKL